MRSINNLYLKIYFSVIFTIFSISIFAQEFKFKNLPNNWNIKEHMVDVNLEGYYDLTNALPKRAVKDGSIDYTEAIQKALDEHRNVTFPPFPILINYKGLSINDGSKLYFPKGAKLILEANNEEWYEMLRLHDVSNIEIYNPKLVGDREAHIGTTGEHGMGISIRGGTDNVKIYNPHIENLWGDAIYLGHLQYRQVKNVTVIGGYLNYNRRNGISITSGENILIEDIIISNTEGTAPESGIKIEPSNGRAVLNNIEIIDVKTYNNNGDGIGFGGIERLIGKTKTPLNISIINHEDKLSQHGLLIGRILSPKSLPGPSLEGEFKIINPKWENSKKKGFTKSKQYGRGPTIKLYNLSAKLEKELWRDLKWDQDVRFIDAKGIEKTLSK